MHPASPCVVHLPLVCGIYPKKASREFACAFLPQTREVVFGIDGGLIEIRYCGFGFVHTRRIVYETVQRELGLPLYNRRFKRAPLVPISCRGLTERTSKRGI